MQTNRELEKQNCLRTNNDSFMNQEVITSRPSNRLMYPAYKYHDFGDTFQVWNIIDWIHSFVFHRNMSFPKLIRMLI